MKKLFLFIIILLVAFLLFALFYINANSEKLISKFLSKQLNTEVAIDSARLSVREINLKGVRVLNPEGSSLSDALTIEHVTIHFQPSTLFKDVVKIDEILLKNPLINIEFYNLKGSDNNWVPIFKNLENSNISPKDKKEAPKKAKKVIIDDFIIENLSVQAQHRMLGAYSLKLPTNKTLTFHDLTDEKALAYKEALTVIFKTLLDPITQVTGFKELLNDIKTSLSISDDIFKKISSQIPSQQGSQDTSESAPDLDKLKEDIEQAPKKISKFFKQLFQ